MTEPGYSYGLWFMVFINSAVFIIFAFSFFKPQTSRDWRSFGAFSAFVVALFTEMYGFPLTIYMLSGWLQTAYPGVDWLAHDSGHLPEMILGWRANPHFGPFHLLSFLLIGGGFWLISVAWHHLWQAQRHDRPLRPHPAPAICRLRADHARIPGAMANAAHPRNVPRVGVDVRSPRPQRRSRQPRSIRRRLGSIYDESASFHSQRPDTGAWILVSAESSIARPLY